MFPNGSSGYSLVHAMNESLRSMIGVTIADKRLSTVEGILFACVLHWCSVRLRVRRLQQFEEYVEEVNNVGSVEFRVG